MEKYSFAKMNGAGNDFVLFDLDENHELSITPEFIRKICSRQFGIGADGVITVRDDDGYDFVMEYYNSDGSLGSLCGNGARCAIKFASIRGKFIGDETKFLCNNLVYDGKLVNSNSVKFNLKAPKNQKYKFKIKAIGQLITSSYIDTGSPHVVICVNDILNDVKNPGSNFKSLDELDLINIGREIRYSPDFAPSGVNVNFIQIENGTIYIRTYERGVENETLACGTGSVAAALVANKLFGVESPSRVVTVTGKNLLVEFKVINNEYSEVSLTGPAEINFTGKIDFNFYK
jgi:diaminopimelate epimerase